MAKIKKNAKSRTGVVKFKPGKGDNPAAKPVNYSAHASQQPIVPFSPGDHILLIGEGDFSFAVSLVTQHRCRHITATSYDDEKTLLGKYPQAEEHVATLRAAGATVRYGIDAMKLSKGTLGLGRKRKRRNRTREGVAGDGDSRRYCWQGEEEEIASEEVAEGEDLDTEEMLPISSHKTPSETPWDGYHRIIFNFPHVGGKSTDVNRQVRYNQELLVAFFRTAIPLLSPSLSTHSAFPSSTIIITLFTSPPYTLWNVPDLARHVGGLRLLRSFAFQPAAYPDYRHARTLGNIEGRGGAWKGEDRGARTYVWEKDDGDRGARDQGGKIRKKKRKRGGAGCSDGDDDDDDDD